MTSEARSAEIYDELRAFFVREFLEGDEAGLDATSPLLELGLINSMSIMMLTSFVDTNFGVELEQRELTPTNLQSLEAITALVKRAESQQD